LLVVSLLSFLLLALALVGLLNDLCSCLFNLCIFLVLLLLLCFLFFLLFDYEYFGCLFFLASFSNVDLLTLLRWYLAGIIWLLIRSRLFFLFLKSFGRLERLLDGVLICRSAHCFSLFGSFTLIHFCIRHRLHLGCVFWWFQFIIDLLLDWLNLRFRFCFFLFLRLQRGCFLLRILFGYSLDDCFCSNLCIWLTRRLLFLLLFSTLLRQLDWLLLLLRFILLYFRLRFILRFFFLLWLRSSLGYLFRLWIFFADLRVLADRLFRSLCSIERLSVMRLAASAIREKGVDVHNILEEAPLALGFVCTVESQALGWFLLQIRPWSERRRQIELAFSP
jgi:hypothetical protein